VSEAFALVQLKAFVARAGLLSQTSPARLMLHTMPCSSQKLLGMLTRVLAALFPFLGAPTSRLAVAEVVKRRECAPKRVRGNEAIAAVMSNAEMIARRNSRLSEGCVCTC